MQFERLVLGQSHCVIEHPARHWVRRCPGIEHPAKHWVSFRPGIERPEHRVSSRPGIERPEHWAIAG